MTPPWLLDRFAQAGGLLSFERFMELALHDPAHGYYARRVAGIGGPRGDFTTCAVAAPALARAVAGWLLRQHRATGLRDVIELGPGTGALARAVRAALPWVARRRLRCHFVESSDPLRALQQKSPPVRGCRWHPDIQSALAAASGEALIYANEFFDAFPVRRFRPTADGWRELGLEPAADGNLTETTLAAPCPPELLGCLPPGPAPPCTWEVHDSVRRWLAAMAPRWRSGALLVIDYGHARPPAHDPRRPHGTLRAYLLQQRLEGAAIYQNPGRQDLTADIRFHDLARWAESLGMRADLLGDQSAFLAPFADPRNPGDRAAIDPHGAGAAFQVLELAAPRIGTALG
jgi:SAM-dependent MidA family methyltransferase